MSLDQSILHGKEKRKPYQGAKAVDRTCRNHGSCDWCRANRQHKFRDKYMPYEIDEELDSLEEERRII